MAAQTAPPSIGNNSRYGCFSFFAARAPAPAAATTGANQYTSEAQAKARCPADTVVYVNLKSKIYHFAGHKDYGNLKNGAYMCEKDTVGAGARAAKNEKHP